MLTRAFNRDSNHKAIIKTTGRNYDFPLNYVVSWFPVSEDKGGSKQELRGRSRTFHLRLKKGPIAKTNSFR